MKGCAARSRRASREWVVRHGEGEAVNRDQAERVAGHVDALPKARDREEARLGTGAELLVSRWRESDPWTSTSVSSCGATASATRCMTARFVKSAKVRPTGRLDERRQLLDYRGFRVGGVALGKVVGHVEQGRGLDSRTDYRSVH